MRAHVGKPATRHGPLALSTATRGDRIQWRGAGDRRHRLSTLARARGGPSTRAHVAVASSSGGDGPPPLGVVALSPLLVGIRAARHDPGPGPKKHHFRPCHARPRAQPSAQSWHNGPISCRAGSKKHGPGKAIGPAQSPLSEKTPKIHISQAISFTGNHEYKVTTYKHKESKPQR